MNTPKRIILFLNICVLSLGFISCTSSSEGQESDAPDNIDIAPQIGELVAKDKYTEALELLEGIPDSPEILTLKEMTHLNYG